MFAFLKFFKRDFMKINFTTEMTVCKYETKTAQSIYAEMRSNLPAACLAFRNKSNYREDLDEIYSIIQPQVASVILNESDKRMLEDAIFIMIQNGISFAPSSNTSFLTNNAGNTRKILYEPLFEKYLTYAVSLRLTQDKLPKILAPEVAYRHMKSTYQYLLHAHEANLQDYAKDSFDTSKMNPVRLEKPLQSKQAMVPEKAKEVETKEKKQETMWGNIFGSLKRTKPDDDVQINDNMFGARVKIKNSSQMNGFK
jgi:hypothetical protein